MNAKDKYFGSVTCEITLVRESTGSMIEGLIWVVPDDMLTEEFIDLEMEKYPGWEVGYLRISS